MPSYPVKCTSQDCPHEAAFKIASRWSDGVTHELKTYFLACEACGSELFAKALEKKAACRLTANESLGDPEVFELTRGHRDRQLVRRQELEARPHSAS
ncbi:MAG: hypothetical protein EXS09_08580 [Gemmataceae bacterium]|nr:hypothetical protein [Gemmataceae bacterium]